MNQEINISQLLENSLISFYKYIARNKLILGLFVFLGIIMGISFYFVNKNTFTSKIIAKPNIYEPYNIYEKQIDEHIGIQTAVTRYDAINAANSLKQIIFKKEKLSKLLFITLNDAKKIKAINSDSIENSIHYFISVEYENTIDLIKLEKGIINYIDSSNYIKNRIRITKQKNRIIASKIDKEILKLEDFQEKILQASETRSKLGEVVVIDNYTNFFHKDILSFNVLKQTYKNNEKTATAVELSQSLTFSKKQKFSFYFSLIISLVLSLSTGFFISTVFDIRKKINKNK